MESMYVEAARKIHAENEKRHIEEIAEKLRKERELEIVRKKQAACSHPVVDRYNHGYHRICRDCGEDL